MWLFERANNGKNPRQHFGINDNGSNGGDGNRHEKSDAMIGILLIILQSTLSVLQDIGEEIFMQAYDFPAMMMLGMEGLYCFCVGFIIYTSSGNKLDKVEDIGSTLATLRKKSKSAMVDRWIAILIFHHWAIQY